MWDYLTFEIQEKVKNTRKHNNFFQSSKDREKLKN